MCEHHASYTGGGGSKDRQAEEGVWTRGHVCAHTDNHLGVSSSWSIFLYWIKSDQTAR